MSNDEIDIEEHDVLDNPVIRKLFPDLSIFKMEEIDLNESPIKDEYFESKVIENRDDKHQKIDEENNVIVPSIVLGSIEKNVEVNNSNDNILLLGWNEKSFYKNFCFTTATQEHAVYGKTDAGNIIKDTKGEIKSCYVSIVSMENKMNLKSIFPCKTYEENKKTSFGLPKKFIETNVIPKINKIYSKNIIAQTSLASSIQKEIISLDSLSKIGPFNCKSNKALLVSNPIRKPVDKKNIRKCDKSSLKCNLTVSLENLHTFLNKSNRYCKKCLILFPSIKTLKDHEQSMHTKSCKNQSSGTVKVKKSLNEKDRYQCGHCNREFFSISYLVRHERIIHQINANTKKRAKLNLNIGQRNSNHRFCRANRKFKCNHCNNRYMSKQQLIDHMYNILQLKNNVPNAVDKVDRPNFDKSIKKADLYRCSICCYYFQKQFILVNHFKMSHYLNYDKKMEKVSFEPICKFCSHKYRNITSFNAHIRKFHKKEFKQASVIKSFKKTAQYVLKSVLFKCMKCDVYFISGNKAVDHTEHMDMLLNWKCLKCIKIFKKEDESLHFQQHLSTDEFNVFEVCETMKSFLLYQCPNCTTYFREEDLFEHYSLCEVQSPNSAYCKVCHILIDNRIKEAHDIHHKQISYKQLNNIFVESDVIAFNEEDCNEEGVKNNKDLEKERILVTEASINGEINTNVAKEKSATVTSQQANSKQIRKKMLSFRYCTKCQSFVSRVHNLYNHSRTNCSDFVTYVCKYCGLIISSKLINTHRKLHQDVPGLTINDFKFYNAQNGKVIKPPIPKYPKCLTCGKHFITKTSIISHMCDEDFVTCPICKTKFSTSAYTLHMSFHNYSPKKKNSGIACELTLMNVESKARVTTFPSLRSSLGSNNGENNLLLNYVCKICKVAVDAYERVIEHCQEHICDIENKISTIPCKICNLILDATCFDNHQMLHASNTEKNFTVLSFDVFYATARNTIWLNHLFGSLSMKEIDIIIGNSIYKYERRIKLKIIQDGLPYLTLYKCAKCESYIDSSLLFKHCNKDVHCYGSNIILPCSFCGIHLRSENSRIEHEKIHRGQNVTLKSYRIVLFNCDEDQTINHALSLPRQYVLYECRNCNGIVDKLLFQNHKCDMNDIAKCSYCGLLLYNNDYMPHVLKHKEFCSYRENNMRVILIGQIKDGPKIKGRIKSSFKGIKSDYLVYRCVNCQVCVNNKESSVTHKCVSNSAITKCHICDLYFNHSQFKSHRKFHESDLYFSITNITLVNFGFVYSSGSKTDVIVIDDEDVGNNIKTVVADNSPNCNDNISPKKVVIEKHDQIFKCICGLHFLNESSAITHYENCNNPRTVKQSCPKCGLVFKPSVLFKHLLIHHGSKDISYNLNIIEISSTTTRSSQVS